MHRFSLFACSIVVAALMLASCGGKSDSAVCSDALESGEPITEAQHEACRQSSFVVITSCMDPEGDEPRDLVQVGRGDVTYAYVVGRPAINVEDDGFATDLCY